MACYLQSGIQTQWNIWDGVFYENSWRAVPVNNFRKKIHLIFHLRGSEFDSDLKHSDKEYIYLTIDILNMIALVLVIFNYNAAVRNFLNTFWKFTGKGLWWKPFLENLSYLKWTQVRASFSLPNTFLWLFRNIERKRIPLNDNIVWCRYSWVIKDLSKSGTFFLLIAPKYLSARFFILSSRKFYVFSDMYSSEQNPWYLKSFFVKICRDLGFPS